MIIKINNTINKDIFCIPSVVNITKEEEELLEKLWSKNHKYIVDPVSYNQGLWLMYDDLSKEDKKKFYVEYL